MSAGNIDLYCEEEAYNIPLLEIMLQFCLACIEQSLELGVACSRIAEPLFASTIQYLFFSLPSHVVHIQCPLEIKETCSHITLVC